MNIKKDDFCLVFSVGGVGYIPISLMQKVAKEELDIHFFLLGKIAEDSQKKIDALLKEYPNLKLTTPGFVKNMECYVAASDIVMTQSGINAAMEALFIGRCVINARLYDAGIGLSKFLEEEKVGFEALNPQKQFKILKNLKENPNEIREIEEKISNLDLKYSSTDFAKKAIQIINSNINRANFKTPTAKF